MTRAYQHDAEWQLQHERTINEQIVAGERRKQAPRMASSHPGTVLIAIPPTADEVERAVRMVDRIADAKRLNRAAVREVLDALGLAGGKTLSRIERVQADRSKPAARCAHCGNRTQTRVDGAFVAHPAKAHTSTETDPCPGSGTHDRAEEVA